MAYVSDLKSASGISFAGVGRVFRSIYRAMIRSQERRAARMLADYSRNGIKW